MPKWIYYAIGFPLCLILTFWEDIRAWRERKMFMKYIKKIESWF